MLLVDDPNVSVARAASLSLNGRFFGVVTLPFGTAWGERTYAVRDVPGAEPGGVAEEVLELRLLSGRSVRVLRETHLLMHDGSVRRAAELNGGPCDAIRPPETVVRSYGVEYKEVLLPGRHPPGASVLATTQGVLEVVRDVVSLEGEFPLVRVPAAACALWVGAAEWGLILVDRGVYHHKSSV